MLLWKVKNTDRIKVKFSFMLIQDANSNNSRTIDFEEDLLVVSPPPPKKEAES